MSCEQCGGPTTTARENAHHTQLLRLMVVNRVPVQDCSLEMLKRIVDSSATPLRVGVRPDEKGWHAVAA